MPKDTIRKMVVLVIVGVAVTELLKAEVFDDSPWGNLLYIILLLGLVVLGAKDLVPKKGAK